MKRTFFLTTLLFLFSISLSWGAIPKTISYQGVLTDPNGVPVPDANYALLFKIYDSSTQLWDETHPIVPVKDGVFNVLLGSITPLDGLAFDRPYDLGITVLPGSEMAPRIPLTASPYSLNPLHSLDAADGSPTNALFVDNNGSVGIGDIGTGERAKLYVNAAGSPNYATFSDHATATLRIGNDGGGNTRLRTDGAQNLVFGPGGSEKVRFTTSGSVGIGTTAPVQKLDTW